MGLGIWALLRPNISIGAWGIGVGAVAVLGHIGIVAGKTG
jgi:hypothetical protein